MEAEGVSAGYGSPSVPLSNEKSHSWLPDGWTVEVRARKTGQNVGMKYKGYIDPISGRMFPSKPQVMSYLSKTKGVQGLPAGWIKKRRLRKDGIKMDLIYVHPNSKYKFSSKKDVMRFVEDGGINSCRSKPVTKADYSWLPDGWTMEVRARKTGKNVGMKYKCYIDPISGQMFPSKPQVISYLSKTNRSVGGKKKASKEKRGSKYILSQEIFCGKKSRSGRVLLPRLEFWRNQRVIYDQDGEVCGVEERV